MEDTTAALATMIGARVRQARLSRGWTLEHLAGAAGISRRALVNVEHGAANPSVGTLLRLSDALGMGLPALVAAPVPPDVRVTRHASAPTLWSSEGGGRGLLVAGTAPPDVVELWDWTLAPGDRHTGEAHAAGTKELLQVHQGAVTVQVGDRPVVLAVGDALAFPGDVPHAYENSGTEAARFSLAVFEPGVGVTGRAETSHG